MSPPSQGEKGIFDFDSLACEGEGQGEVYIRGQPVDKSEVIGERSEVMEKKATITPFNPQGC